MRFGAMLLDALFIAFPLAILSLIVSGDGNGGFFNLLSFLYSLVLPVIWNGRTIGKKMCGIQIRKVDDHLPPNLFTMLLRNVVAGIIYGLTLGIGVIVSICMVVLREDHRAIHDFIAGTEVVYDN